MIIIYMINFHLIKKTGNWFKEKFDECWRKKKKEEYKLFNLNCEMKYWSMDTDRIYNNVFIIKFESVCFSIISYDLVCVCIERVINLKQNRDFILKWNFFCFLKFYFYTFCTFKTIYMSVCTKIDANHEYSKTRNSCHSLFHNFWLIKMYLYK